MLNPKYDLNIPTYCPKCESELELDIELEKTTLLCPNSDCDFKLDVTKEFEKASKALDEELEQETKELAEELEQEAKALDEELKQETFEARHGTPNGDDYHRYVE